MFKGNPRLRGTGEVVEMNEEQMQEWLKCSQDIFTFATYFYINADDGAHPIKLRPYQEKIVQTLVANVPKKNNRIIMQRTSVWQNYNRYVVSYLACII